MVIHPSANRLSCTIQLWAMDTLDWSPANGRGMVRFGQIRWSNQCFWVFAFFLRQRETANLALFNEWSIFQWVWNNYNIRITPAKGIYVNRTNHRYNWMSCRIDFLYTVCSYKQHEATFYFYLHTCYKDRHKAFRLLITWDLFFIPLVSWNTHVFVFMHHTFQAGKSL